MALAASLLLPASALAADTYVNNGGPAQITACTTPTHPCNSIAAGLSFAGPGDTVWVEDGVYNESVGLGGDKSVRQLDFAIDPDPAAIVNGGADPAIEVSSGNPAGTVEGLVLRANNDFTVVLDDVATITGNTLDSIAAGKLGILVREAGGVPEVSGNQLSPIAPADTTGIAVTGSSATIEGNDLSGLGTAVVVSSSPRVIANTITGTTTGGTGTGFGISVTDSISGPATIRGNTIREPGEAGSVGVRVADDPIGLFGAAAADLERNRILGHSIGVQVDDADSLELNSDLVAGNSTGISVVDGTGGGSADVSATNVTVYDNTARDISLDGNHLDLNSSIVETQIEALNAASCTITFSRGPVYFGAPPPDCTGNFQTNADPGFVNAAGGDYHLAAGSALIDQGDPVPPPGLVPLPNYNPGSRDIDGDSRGLDGNCDGTATRDIGADERVVNCASSPPPDAGGGSGGTDGTGDGGAGGGGGTDSGGGVADTDPPETTIKRTKVKGDDVKLTFTSDEPGSTFTCKVDRKKAKPCTSPRKVKNLDDGRHKVKVTAIDAAGNADPSAAKAKFKIDD